MGNFVNSNLVKDESVVYEAKVHWAAWIAPVILALIVGLFTFFIGTILVLVWYYFVLKNIELVITNKRIIAKHGVIGKHTFEQNIGKIESVQVTQGVFGRMLGMGSVIVTGTGGSKEVISYIESPFEFRKKFVEMTA